MSDGSDPGGVAPSSCSNCGRSETMAIPTECWRCYQHRYRHGRAWPDGLLHGTGAPLHATYTRYTQGCRCRECRDAWAEFCRIRTDVRHLLMVEGKVHPIHGRYTTYKNYRCRCGACTAAHSEECARQRARRRQRRSEQAASSPGEPGVQVTTDEDVSETGDGVIAPTRRARRDSAAWSGQSHPRAR